MGGRHCRGSASAVVHAACDLTRRKSRQKRETGRCIFLAAVPLPQSDQVPPRGPARDTGVDRRHYDARTSPESFPSLCLGCPLQCHLPRCGETRGSLRGNRAGSDLSRTCCFAASKTGSRRCWERARHARLEATCQAARACPAWQVRTVDVGAR